MKHRLRRWLGDVAVRDPIERRKAEFLHFMLIGLCAIGILGSPLSLVAPLSLIDHILTIAADLLLSIFALVALGVLQRGRLHLAVLIGTCGLLIPLAITFVTLGLSGGAGVLIAFTLPVTLAGLLMGRGGLVFAVTTSLAIVLCSALFDTGRPAGMLPANHMPIGIILAAFSLILVLLGVFLDRFGSSLYQTLSEMAARERDLEQSRAALEKRTAALEREIVERRRMEAALSESEDKFRALVTHSPVGIFQTSPTGAYMFVNKQWTELTSMAAEAAIGQGWAQALHPADATRVLDEWHAATSSGRKFAQEYRFLDEKGNIRWVFSTADPLYNPNRQVLGYFGIISDITENKRAREALRESEERYRLITENTNDLISLYDHDQQHVCVYASPSHRHVLGYEPSMLHTIATSDLIHPDDREAIHKLFVRGAAPGTAQATYRQRHADASWRWIEAHATTIIQQGRHYTLLVGRDFTDRKRLEAQFLQAQKMESIGRLAGGIAHDFNNLLTAIIGNTELALDALPNDHTARADVAEIARAADRAVGLTRQLLAFARQQIIEPHVLDLSRLLLDMGTLLRRLLGEDVELATIAPSLLWRVKGDPNQIEQVVINLAVNARDAMPNGGKLTLEITNTVLDDELAQQHVGLPPGRYVVLAISDTGMGMDEETQRRAFEPFFTTKPKGRGTGLGLATSYGIIQQHGGNIWVYSEINHGTTFKIYLPGIDDPADIPQQVIASPDLPRGNETILLVEDEPAVRELAARILRTQGYQVIEATQGREALGMIDGGKHLPIDLLLTDVVMPQMSGKAIAEHLQGRFPTLKVLYISGYTDNAIVHHGRLTPGVAFLHKPFTPAALVRKVRDVLGA